MALSQERKTQLLGLVKQIKAGQSAGALSTGERAKKAGIAGPIDKTTFGKLAAAQIGETAPSEERAATGFEQEQEERKRSRGLFGDRFPGFREVPKGRGAGGEVETGFEEEPGIVGARETGVKLAEGQRAAERSLSVVSTTLNDFSKVIVGAFDEGGFGDIIKAGKTALKQRFAGGLATSELVQTGKIPGKKVEIITKMMPLLTQQGDKPGSVRLVSTVFERLSDSLPGANKRGDVRGNDISLQEARGMMEESIKSMLRFAQAIQSLGITNESVEQVAGKVGPDGKPEKGSELSKLGEVIERVSQQFFQEGSPEEEQITQFLAQALAPIDERIARLGQPEGGAQFQIGQIIDTPQGQVRVVGGDLSGDPDVEPVQ